MSEKEIKHLQVENEMLKQQVIRLGDALVYTRDLIKKNDKVGLQIYLNLRGKVK